MSESRTAHETASRTARIVQAIAEIPAADWDACAQADGNTPPSLRHGFLRALEESGSVSAAQGWQPLHLLLEDAQGQLQGLLPMYLKSHSQGEYVFDHAWAEAWQRSGGQYYPKLQVSVPFTPVTGPRLLVHPTADAEATSTQLVAGAIAFAEQLQVSSLHFTFLPQPQWQQLGAAGLLQRTDRQFHWHNPGYHHFDEFLAALSARKRKNIKRERRDVASLGGRFEWLTGADITEAHWDAFYRFYLDTSNRKWGRPYLNRRFFSLLGEQMADALLLILYRRGERYVAGALNLLGADRLYGRNWGCSEAHDFLHFETCYYQAMEFAIAKGLRWVEAGAQGSHKLARGYLPHTTYSAHWLADAGFRQAVADYLQEERSLVREDLALLNQHSPFRDPTRSPLQG